MNQIEVTHKTTYFNQMIQEIFEEPVSCDHNFIFNTNSSEFQNQEQTTSVFSEKWDKLEQENEKNTAFQFQKEWYLKLYGFNTEEDLGHFLKKQRIILDAGCGLGYKAAWFAELAPESLIIGMDLSSGVRHAAQNYRHLPNLFFVQSDIAFTGLRHDSIDYVSCDQVIMHTENPDNTFKHLAQIVKKHKGEFACYVYAKKALPRELIDDYFRKQVHHVNNEDLWKMSEQLTELGKTLSDLNVKIDVPDIPLLNIKGGSYDLQRFIYWNFLKCFWNEDLGYNISVNTNFDWYSPSNAKRYDKEEFLSLIKDTNMKHVYFHEEEACFSGRFAHN